LIRLFSESLVNEYLSAEALALELAIRASDGADPGEEHLHGRIGVHDADPAVLGGDFVVALCCAEMKIEWREVSSSANIGERAVGCDGAYESRDNR